MNPHRQKLAPHVLNHSGVRGDAVPARRQTARHYFRSLPGPTPPPFSKRLRASLFGTRRLPYKLRIRLGPKAPSVEACSTRDRDGRQATATNTAKSILHATVTIMHLTIGLFTNKHALVSKMGTEQPKLPCGKHHEVRYPG